jgi:hypothetical protein
MENKIYNQCREEAKKIVYERSASTTSHEHMSIEIHQLTAELYAQKFADWIQPKNGSKNYYYVTNKKWVSLNNTTIGTTSDLHEKFVEENKGGENVL